MCSLFNLIINFWFNFQGNNKGCLTCGEVVKEGVFLPPNCSGNSLKGLQSDKTVLIDLDKEIKESIDEKGKKEIQNDNTNLFINRLLFSIGKIVCDEISNITSNTSNSINQIVFMSSNYRLLKFCDVKSITYFIPSESYYSTLKLQSGWNEALYQEVKNDVMNRKSDKIKIFVSADDLCNQLSSLFNLNIKV